MSSYPGRESKTTGESLLCPVEFRLTSSVCASPLRVVASNSAGLRRQRALCSQGAGGAAAPRLGRAGEGWVSFSSPSIRAKKLSARAVPALAGAPDGQGELAVPGQVGEAADTYWQPLSDWKTTPGSGRRAVMALAR